MQVLIHIIVILQKRISFGNIKIKPRNTPIIVWSVAVKDKLLQFKHFFQRNMLCFVINHIRIR